MSGSWRDAIWIPGQRVVMVDDHMFTQHATQGAVGTVTRAGYVDWGNGEVRTHESRIELAPEGTPRG